MKTTSKDARVAPTPDGERVHGTGGAHFEPERRTSWPRSTRAGVLLLVGAAGTLACAAELEGKPEDYKAAYEGPPEGSGAPVNVPPEPECVKMVFAKATCTAACHGAAALGGLDLTGNDLGARLSRTAAQYQVPASQAASCDKGALLIQADDPSRSVLLRKVNNTQTCGDPMPQSGGLMGDDLKCIEDWVKAFSVSANKISVDDGSGIGGSSP